MEGTLIQEATRLAQSHDELWKTLNKYAEDLGVSVDHVIVGSLRLVAEVYDNATGDGMIPILR